MEMNFQVKIKNSDNGFALLLAILVVSVVLAISLSFLNITLKQFTLSVSARDSEMAVHAANTGMDCLRYYLSDPSTRDDFYSAAQPSIACGDASAATPLSTNTITSNGEQIYRHTYRFDISNTNTNLCADISIYTAQPENNDISYNLTNEGLNTFTCDEDLNCAFIFSRGYNRPCDDLDSIRTVQRELTISY